jgi:hypothetical protein
VNVLIVTKSDDNECVDMVTRALERRGARAFRFDTDAFPGEVDVRVHLDGATRHVEIARGGETLELGDAHRGLVSTPGGGQGHPRDARAPGARGERRGIAPRRLGALASLACFVMDPWVRLRLAETKQLQLELARALGLDVPRTLVTNDPAAVRAFYDECRGRIVTKMMASFAVLEDGPGEGRVHDAARAGRPRGARGPAPVPDDVPGAVQKARELRVTVVGRRVFCAAIDRRLERSKTDWRREGSRCSTAGRCASCRPTSRRACSR